MSKICNVFKDTEAVWEYFLFPDPVVWDYLHLAFLLTKTGVFEGRHSKSINKNNVARADILVLEILILFICK